MLYFVYKPSITTGGNTLMAVSEPTKNAKGLYKVSSKKISIPGSKVGTFNSFTSVSGFVIFNIHCGDTTSLDLLPVM